MIYAEVKHAASKALSWFIVSLKLKPWSKCDNKLCFNYLQLIFCYFLCYLFNSQRYQGICFQRDVDQSNILRKSETESKVIGQGGLNVSSHEFDIFRGYFKLVKLNIVSSILNKLG